MEQCVHGEYGTATLAVPGSGHIPAMRFGEVYVQRWVGILSGSQLADYRS